MDINATALINTKILFITKNTIFMSSTKFLLGALLGAAVGVQIGILVAPDKGENTRKKLGKKSNEYLDDVTGKLNSFFDGLTKKVSDVSDEVDKLAKKAKAETDKLTK
jgi:gas vesicle protein